MEIRSDIEIAVVGMGFLVEWRGKGGTRRAVCENRTKLGDAVFAAAEDVRQAQKGAPPPTLNTRAGDLPTFEHGDGS